MLLIEIEIRETKSKRHPIAVFSDQFIAQGEVVWVFDPRLDISIDSEDIFDLQETPKRFLTKNAFRDMDGTSLLVCSMGENFIRRSSKDGNISMDKSYLKGDWYAIRDIEPGEELVISL